MLQINRKSSKKARIPFQDIQNQKRFSPAKSPKEKNGHKSLEHFVLTTKASSTGADENQYPCNEPVEELEKIEELYFGKTTLLKRQTRAYSEEIWRSSAGRSREWTFYVQRNFVCLQSQRHLRQNRPQKNISKNKCTNFPAMKPS